MRLLAAVLAIAVSCSAQAPAKRKAAPKAPITITDNWPLVALNIKGNRLYTEQQIVAVTGLKLGQPTTKPQFEAARANLITTGAFESVGLEFGPSTDGKGYTGTFEVVEVEQLYPIRFEDLPATDAQLRAYLTSHEPLFRDKIPGTKEVLNRIAGDIQAFLEKSNFKDKVSGRITADKPGELVATFRPGTPIPAIAEVQFVGNQAIPSSTLNNTLSGVAIGVPYRESAMRQLLDTSIRPLYDGRGRLNVTFGKIETEKAKDVDGVRVKIQVDEGSVYKFGTIESKVPVLQPRRVLKLATFKTGDVANFDAVGAVIDGIQKELRKEGYMRSQTRAERVVHNKEQTVDIAFNSILGQQFRMGKLKVEGLDVVTEPAVRKLWSVVEGNPYNADYPQLFCDRIKEDGYFDNLKSATWDQSINEKTSTVDVTLYFKGGADPRDEERRKRRREQEQQPPFDGR